MAYVSILIITICLCIYTVYYLYHYIYIDKYNIFTVTCRWRSWDSSVTMTFCRRICASIFLQDSTRSGCTDWVGDIKYESRMTSQTRSVTSLISVRNLCTDEKVEVEDHTCFCQINLHRVYFYESRWTYSITFVQWTALIVIFGCLGHSPLTFQSSLSGDWPSMDRIPSSSLVRSVVKM